MKKALLILALLGILLMVAGCSDGIRIRQNNVYVEDIILSIRHGYKLAEDCYSIRETAEGYDIIIHAIKEDTGK